MKLPAPLSQLHQTVQSGTQHTRGTTPLVSIVLSLVLAGLVFGVVLFVGPHSLGLESQSPPYESEDLQPGDLENNPVAVIVDYNSTSDSLALFSVGSEPLTQQRVEQFSLLVNGNRHEVYGRFRLGDHTPTQANPGPPYYLGDRIATLENVSLQPGDTATLWVQTAVRWRSTGYISVSAPPREAPPREPGGS